mgnify:CR=1 FL=1
MKHLYLTLILLFNTFFSLGQQINGVNLTSCQVGQDQDTFTIIANNDGPMVITGGWNVVLGTCGGSVNPNFTVSLDVYVNSSFSDGSSFTNLIGSTGPLSSNPNPTLVTTTVPTGAELTVIVSMNATSGEAPYSFDYSFTPLSYQADPEPNDTFEQAILTQEAVFYEGRGSMDNVVQDIVDLGVDWYKLTAPNNGALNISWNGDSHYSSVLSNLEIYNEINNEPGLLLGSYGLASTNGFLAINETCIQEGETIYLRFESSNSSYRFAWSMMSLEILGQLDIEPNNLSSEALDINLNENKLGNIGYGTTADEDINDWYRFEIPQNSDITIAYSDSQPDGVLTTSLYRELDDGSLTLVSESSSSQSNYSCMEAGTYFFQISEFSNPFTCENCCTTYSLTISSTNDVTVNDDTEPNNEFTNSTFVANNTSNSGTLGYTDGLNIDGVDIYELNLQYNGPIDITFQEPIDPNFVALNVSTDGQIPGGQIGNFNLDNNGMVSSISYNCASTDENYFLYIYSSGQCSQYTFEYNNTFINNNNESEPNNDTMNAQLLGEFDNIFGQVNYGFVSFDAIDIYSIEVNEDAPLKIFTQIEDDITIALYEDNSFMGNFTQDSSSGPLEFIEYSNANSNHNYYLYVYGSDIQNCSNYELLGWNQNFTAENDTEPNNSQFETTAINFNQDYEGRLSYYSSGSDTEDYYSFTLSQNDDVEFQLNAFEGLNNNASLTVYDAVNSNQVFQLIHDGTNSSRTTNTINLNAGNYYFIITGTDQTGSYDFRVTPQNTLSINNFIDITASIFPNPAKDEIKISLNNHHEVISASIVDITGKSVNTFDINSSETQLNITSLERGLYFIVLKTDNSTITKRFIKH